MGSWRRFPLLQAYAKRAHSTLGSLKYVFCGSGISPILAKSKTYETVPYVALVKERFCVGNDCISGLWWLGINKYYWGIDVDYVMERVEKDEKRILSKQIKILKIIMNRIQWYCKRKICLKLIGFIPVNEGNSVLYHMLLYIYYHNTFMN